METRAGLQRLAPSGFPRKINVIKAECYSRHVREPESNPALPLEPLPFWRVLLEHRKWFFLFTLAALALRLVFYFKFPHITGDSLIYGDIAKNWLDHGILA